ncbi:DUF6427 family protein [Chryseobacterium sp. T1]
MFRLLSKESNIFSIPVYIGFLLLIIIGFNTLDINTLDIGNTIITFAGFALGYFLFNRIALNYQTHLPLFLYTFLVFAFYPGNIGLGLSVTLLINSFLLFILTDNSDRLRKGSYLLVGALLTTNFLFAPECWPMIIFVGIHIFVTSGNAALNFFRFIFGALLISLSYFGLMYIIDYRSWNPYYLPFNRDFKILTDYFPLYFLIPIVLLLIYAIIDHFNHFNEKSPSSKYKYTFLLMFSIAQLTSIVLYMGKNHEYILLLALPASIILSRMLKFFPKYWMQESGVWLIFFCLLIYKISPYFNFNL